MSSYSPLRVWAPKATESVDLVVGYPDSAAASDITAGSTRRALDRAEGGWWQLQEALPAGTDYAFSIDGGRPAPDPRSRWQPHGVHGPSRAYHDGSFPWTDQGWRGLDVRGGVIYELHVGTFTDPFGRTPSGAQGGTFDAAIERLDELVELGIDTVEVMPIAAFPGRHGWGYDGVDLYAVHAPYGGPDGFKRFVDACHARGLGVVLDVVYNHLGPSGNYLSVFGPYFTEAHQTPWGAAVNLDDSGSDEVRRYLIDNAVMWLRDYHCDGLRLDAVHALLDDRAVHVLEELSAEVDALAGRLGRPLTLIAESDRNDVRTVTPREAGGLGLQAQWDDDVHHALHALLTGERQGYYCDFGSLEVLRKVWEHAFLHDGTYSTFRGRHHGRPVDPHTLSGHRLVAFLQDHDQVGNRATGDRLAATVPPGLLKVGAALLLTSPFTPMLWMGEEWAASTPWCYFTDHQEPELAEAIRQGRRREFASHGWAAEDIPDPQAESTVASSVLSWDERRDGVHGEVLSWYRELIALRRREP
ncbi:MAG: malto-oligosyltrehalose trehalohydrolase, partial [Actinomycetes bacterium]